MAADTKRPPSRLIDDLPAIYHADPWLGQFLLAFEKVFLGRQDDVDLCYKGNERVGHDEEPDVCYRGLEEAIADLALLVDPFETPAEFLPWLASWTAFSLRADLEEDKQRQFVARIIPLYSQRGTAQNLRELLAIFTVGQPKVIEMATAFQVGVHSTIGVDTYLDGGTPHFFRVVVALPRMAQEGVLRQTEIARNLIELEKPAHTYYELVVTFPSMQIGVASTVGVDTLIGVLPESDE